LRVKGISKASKKMSRDAREGVVVVSGDDSKKSVIEVNCETDFVAKNADFGKLVDSLIDVAIENDSKNLEELLSATIDGITVSEKIVEQTGVIGEKLELSYYEVVEGETVYGYNHPGNQIATLIGLSEEVDEIYAKDCAMQAAAMAPVAINEEGVSQEIIDKEIEIAKELLRQEGKPEKMIDQIAQGKLKKFFKESTLLNQAFIKDNKKSIKQYLSEASKDLTVVSMKRFSMK
ncbi:MAG: elongation factor Ts, partial [Flavobacteriales bacterium]|nr:elongation factor Ts [Flavobacteriales bacterium]